MEAKTPDRLPGGRREMVKIFRSRLLEALDRIGMTRAALARATGVDRSTLSQLLSPANDRLPRADTVAAIAFALRVSLDWLLGLSQEDKLGADVLQESLQFTPSARTPVDENLACWHDEAVGYKIRHVPATLPDLMKTEEVLRYEFEEYVAKTVDQAIAASHGRLAYTRHPETDMEICMPRQSLEAFARGEGTWNGLDAAARVEQLGRMAMLCEELYPALRLHLFDAMTRYSVPYTIFGPLRAAIYVGQVYFVFTTTPHIRTLTRHFDELVRAAAIEAKDAGAFLKDLSRWRAGG
ncbi:MAG: helix-turn-helix domain-containing protein [Alphaproteobacteria bacterium]|nr:helix-turn-helix domain-containing protein [Alphaproteobacteria bacterium]